MENGRMEGAGAATEAARQLQGGSLEVFNS
jgi:hypothetical protein